MSSSDRSVKRVKRSSNDEYNTLLECLEAIKQDDPTKFLASFIKFDDSSHKTKYIVRFAFMCTNTAFAIKLMDSDVHFSNSQAIIGISKVGNIEMFNYYVITNHICFSLAFVCIQLAAANTQFDYLRHFALHTQYAHEVIITCIKHNPSLAIELLLDPKIMFANIHYQELVDACVACKELRVMQCITDHHYPITVDSIYHYTIALSHLEMYNLAIECIQTMQKFHRQPLDWDCLYENACAMRAYPIAVFLIRSSSQRLNIRPTCCPRNINVLQSLYVCKYINASKCRKLITAIPEWRHIATNMVLLQSAFGVPVEITRFIRKFLY